MRGLFTVLLVGAAMVLTGDWRYWRSALGTAVLARSLLDAASSALCCGAGASADDRCLGRGPAEPGYRHHDGGRDFPRGGRCPSLARGACRLCRGIAHRPAGAGLVQRMGNRRSRCCGCQLDSRRADPQTRPGNPTTVLAFTSMVALTLVGVGLGLSGAWLPLSAYELPAVALAGPPSSALPSISSHWHSVAAKSQWLHHSATRACCGPVSPDMLASAKSRTHGRWPAPR